MGEFRVHHVQFFEYSPAAINCLSYDENFQKIALSRSDGTIEIWSVSDNWFQEKIIPPFDGKSVETVVWCKGRLFSAGLQGDVLEYCLTSLSVKHTISTNSGAVWNLTLNDSKTVLAAATEEGCVVLFTVTTNGLEYLKSLDKQEGRILSLAWYEPENVIVTGGLDNIRIWSVKSGHAIQRLTPGRQERNRETIVWAIALANDFTIVSGDSRGKVCFWNGRQGTQIKSFQVNKADVLCLCVGVGGNTVFVGGVEPVVAQFEYVPVKADSDWKMWVMAGIWSQHTHDVRALAYCGDNKIVSAGVDCQLIVNNIDGKRGRGCKKISPISQESLVNVARSKELVLLRYPDHIDVWKLGHTTASADRCGEVLPLTRGPSKLVQLSCKTEEYVVCAAISDSGQWIAYSDTNKPKLFHLTVDDGVPRLQKVKWVPPELLPARRMAFTQDGSKLLLVSCTGVLQVLKVDAAQPDILHVFENQTDHAGVHLLSVSDCGQYTATGDHNSNIHIYDLHSLKHVCSLPKRSRQPTAMCFHPSEPVLAVVYADRQLYEYCIEEQEYTAWSRALNKNYHPQWLKRHSKFTQLMYNPHKCSQLFLRDEKMICIIDKAEPFPSPSQNLFAVKPKSEDDKAEAVKHCFHICTKYKYLLHINILSEDFLTVVERSPTVIEEELPPTLKLKKFGT